MTDLSVNFNDEVVLYATRDYMNSLMNFILLKLIKSP